MSALSCTIHPQLAKEHHTNPQPSVTNAMPGPINIAASATYSAIATAATAAAAAAAAATAAAATAAASAVTLLLLRLRLLLLSLYCYSSVQQSAMSTHMGKKGAPWRSD